MTGKQFVEYLVESGLFSEKVTCYLVDNPITCNRIPGHIKYNFPRQFYYVIECSYHPNQKIKQVNTNESGIWVNFHFGPNNPYHSEKLSELSIPKLIEIMSKFLNTHEEFTQWKSNMIVKNREYKLSEIIEEN